ncbi:MAG: hypothetical protein AMJ81_08205 [Phycisphaerae bacterium SM23_33]|nr:MAG: hypothetical protein AMJ81_08205 [Phycisphaerae bacterium SM23_33]
MLLEDVSIHQLTLMLEPRMVRPAWPGLNDPRVKARARRFARRLGLWGRLGQQVSAESGHRDIPSIPLSAYSEYDQRGSRQIYEQAWARRLGRTERAALALWLGHPAGDVDYLQDLLWAWCENATWTHAAHAEAHSPAVDLWSVTLGRMLAEILCMFDGRLGRRVQQRVGREIERRLLDAIHDWRQPPWWQAVRMNWSHVCNSGLIAVALYRIRDPEVLAAFIHPLCVYLDYGLQGFADDGGCLEGAGYWDYGFGHFVDAAVMLHHRTGGRLNLMAGEKIKRICRYPLAVHLDGPNRVAYSDCAQGFFKAQTMLKINRFHRMPELYAAADRTRDGFLNVQTWRGLALYRGEKPLTGSDAGDYVLPDTGFAKLRAARRKATAIGVLAGRNDWPHNHNDIGSFVLYANRRFVIVDPGAPRYTKKTFSRERFDILFCSSRGHSVPVVNGRYQPGVENGDIHGHLPYVGTLRVKGHNGDGPKRAAVDMTRAYDDKTLKRLTRELVLDRDGALTVADDYEFSRTPRSIEEAFVTFERARAAGSGRSVLIGQGRGAVRLSATGAGGRFAVQRLVEESEEGRTGDVLRRITFTPNRLQKSMRLAFRFSVTTRQPHRGSSRARTTPPIHRDTSAVPGSEYPVLGGLHPDHTLRPTPPGEGLRRRGGQLRPGGGRLPHCPGRPGESSGCAPAAARGDPRSRLRGLVLRPVPSAPCGLPSGRGRNHHGPGLHGRAGARAAVLVLVG